MKRKREDAVLNRDEILKAAKQVINEHGADLSFDEIARKAKVGRATLYRNFSDRHELVMALFDANLKSLEELVEHLGERPDAFLKILEAVLDQTVENRFLSYLYRSPSFPEKSHKYIAERYSLIFSGTFKKAQKDGAVRRDLTVKDLGLIVAMAAGGFEYIKKENKQGIRFIKAFIFQSLTSN